MLAMHQQLTDEHYTPPWVVDPIRRFCGGISLDPASCAQANKFIKAERFFSKREGEDGLLLAWEGTTLWLNPPYSGTKDWVDYAMINWVAGNITDNMFFLVNANVGTEWFTRLQSCCSFMTLFDKRIAFVGENGKIQNQPTHGNALFACIRYRPAHELFWYESFDMWRDRGTMTYQLRGDFPWQTKK